MFKDNTIYNGVMRVVKERIQKAQESYDTSVDELEKVHEEEVYRLVDVKDKAKIELAQKHIDSILGKVL